MNCGAASASPRVEQLTRGLAEPTLLYNPKSNQRLPNEVLAGGVTFALPLPAHPQLPDPNAYYPHRARPARGPHLV